MKDIKYLGIPNVCFSLLDNQDKRETEYSVQRIERGFDDSETWSLRDTFSLFMIPRLKRYIEITGNLQNNQDVKCFLLALELISRDNGICIHTEQEKKQIQEGLQKFPEIFMKLWW